MVTVSPYYKQKNVLNPFYTVIKAVNDKVSKIVKFQNPLYKNVDNHDSHTPLVSEELYNNNFNEFDRLEFIKNYLMPLSRNLEKEFQLRVANIHQFMEEAVSHDTERIGTVKTRLRAAIDELKLNVDENRFEQELIFYLEKYDITEEKVRLGNHLNYFKETLNGNEANGRKLGFITQEMGREINTMGSKSNHTEMQKLVVMMKDELEKIKEQSLNVL